MSHKRRRGEGKGLPAEDETDAAPDSPTPAPPAAVRFGPGRFEDEYELGDQLGRGTFSIVRRCKHRRSGTQRAVKIIDTRRFRLSSTFRSVSVLDEVRILQSLDHPHIIKTFEVYDQALEGHEAVFIVTELAAGGELFDSIIKKGNFTEPQARHVMWQALSALEYMHAAGVIHRDLKPENVLVFSSTMVPADDPVVRDSAAPPVAGAAGGDVIPMLNVKVADFGVARYVGESAAASGAATFVGSPQYVAPEVLFAREHAGATYGRAVDVYSLGVILYVCLAGYLPFDDNAPVPPDAVAGATAGRSTWEERVKAGRFYFAPPVWTHISTAAQDLIRRMLELDPTRRFTVSQAMAHPWFDAIRAAAAPPAAPPLPALSAPAAVGTPMGSATANEMTPLISEIAALGLSSPKLLQQPAAAATVSAPPSQRDPYNVMFQQQRLLLTANGSPAPAGAAATSLGPPTAGHAAPAGRVGYGAAPAAGMDLTALPAGLSASGRAAADEGMGTAAPSSSGVLASDASAWQRELGLNGSGSSGVGGGSAGPSGSGGSSGEDSERDMRILATVAKSLDFDALLTMQRNTAATFRAAYSAVRYIPNAAAVLRKHAVQARELQHQVHKVTIRCRSLAQSILAIFPDLYDSIVDQDVPLSQSIFDRLRCWIGEVKVEAQRMQTTYAGLIMEVQMSVETARALLPLSLHTHHHHVHTAAAAAAAPAITASAAALPAAPPAPPATATRTESSDTHMLLPAGDAPSGGAPVERTDVRGSAGSRGGGAPASPPLSATTPDSGNSPLLLARPTSSTSPHAGDELMEMLFDTPSVVSDDRRLQRILTRLGVSSEAGHVVATRSSPASAVIAAMQQHGGGGSGGGGSSGFPGALLGAPAAAWPAGPARDTVPLHPSGPAPPEQHLARAFVPPQSISPKAAAAVAAASELSTTRDAGSSGPPGGGSGFTEGAGGGASSDSDSSGSSLVPLSVIGDGGKCLGCALADLRRVDVILSSSVEFWTSMELVIDVAVRRKEHSETLLLHASSRRALAKANSSLHDYMAFWQAFHFLCGRYAEALQLADLYAWLNAPDAADEPHVHLRVAAEAPGAGAASQPQQLQLLGIGGGGDAAAQLKGAPPLQAAPQQQGQQPSLLQQPLRWGGEASQAPLSLIPPLAGGWDPRRL